MTILKYDLVINQTPIRKISINDSDMLISSLNLSSNFILFLEILDV